MRLLVLVLLALVLPVLAAPAPAAPLAADGRGPVRVVDGDTLELGGAAVRLYGIDAPEIGQVCMRAGAPWACGAAAAALLRRLVQGREIACQAMGRDDAGHVVAKCRAGWMDLGAEMVTRGMALADPRAGYLPNYREARALGEGIFAGAFVAPARWRRGERLAIESAN